MERALTVPEDRSYGDCLAALPAPGSHLRISDPFPKDKKKGGKAKKGAKKSGGGKKKKKK